VKKYHQLGQHERVFPLRCKEPRGPGRFLVLEILAQGMKLRFIKKRFVKELHAKIMCEYLTAKYSRVADFQEPLRQFYIIQRSKES
jgi:hypothetical protein